MPRPRRIRDPLLPLSERALRRQARLDVRSQVDPIVAELTRSINQRAAAGAQNIEGVTNRLAQGLAGYEQRVGGIYGQARGQLGALNTEAANRIGAAGQGGADALRASLAAAGLPTAGADALAGAGRGASAASYASGAAELGQLIQNEASGRTYAAAMPGLARLGGLQGIRELQARRQQDLSEGLADIRSKVPGLVSQTMSEGRRREYEKAVAMRGFGLDVAKLEQEAGQAAADAALARREKATERRFEARQNALDRQADLRKAQIEYDRDMAKARAEWAHSDRSEAAKRRFEAKQNRIKRRFERRENAKDRAARKKGSSSSASGLGP